MVREEIPRSLTVFSSSALGIRFPSASSSRMIICACAVLLSVLAVSVPARSSSPAVGAGEKSGRGRKKAGRVPPSGGRGGISDFYRKADGPFGGEQNSVPLYRNAGDHRAEQMRRADMKFSGQFDPFQAFRLFSNRIVRIACAPFQLFFRQAVRLLSPNNLMLKMSEDIRLSSRWIPTGTSFDSLAFQISQTPAGKLYEPIPVSYTHLLPWPELW